MDVPAQLLTHASIMRAEIPPGKRRIYVDYAKGKSPLTIVKELNAEKVPSPRGGPWRLSTLNGDV